MSTTAVSLPEHLSRVSDIITRQLARSWRAGVKDRLKLLGACESDKILQGQILDRCRRDPVYFIDNFCWLMEPRNPPKGLPAWLPFVLYPKQRELVRWLQTREATSSNGAVPKSRGVGATWVCVAYSIWCWLFRPGFKITWGTLTEADLDAKDNPDSVFEKFRIILKRLPEWFRRSMIPGFGDRNDNHRRLYNPDNGSVITGEIGDNMGRSGRSAIYFLDEAAHADYPEAKERAIQETTDCLIEISTPNGVDNPFATKVRRALVDTLYMRWDDIPWRPPEWLEWRRLTRYAHDELGFRQEILIDFLGTAEWTAIPPTWIQAAVDYELFAGTTASGGFDVAKNHDRNVFTPRRGPCVEPQEIWGVMAPHDSAARVASRCEFHGISMLSFDAIGVGEGVASYFGTEARAGHAFDFEVIPVVSSQKPTEAKWAAGQKTAQDLFGNLRAEMWWTVRERFRKTYANRHEGTNYPDSECISIPDEPELINELSWLEYKHARGGKIFVESKEDMKKRRKSSKSPDRADSLIYSFADDLLTPQRAPTFHAAWV